MAYNINEEFDVQKFITNCQNMIDCLNGSSSNNNSSYLKPWVANTINNGENPDGLSGSILMATKALGHSRDKLQRAVDKLSLRMNKREPLDFSNPSDLKLVQYVEELAGDLSTRTEILARAAKSSATPMEIWGDKDATKSNKDVARLNDRNLKKIKGLNASVTKEFNGVAEYLAGQKIGSRVTGRNDVREDEFRVFQNGAWKAPGRGDEYDPDFREHRGRSTAFNNRNEKTEWMTKAEIEAVKQQQASAQEVSQGIDFRKSVTKNGRVFDTKSARIFQQNVGNSKGNNNIYVDTETIGRRGSSNFCMTEVGYTMNGKGYTRLCRLKPAAARFLSGIVAEGLDFQITGDTAGLQNWWNKIKSSDITTRLALERMLGRFEHRSSGDISQMRDLPSSYEMNFKDLEYIQKNINYLSSASIPTSEEVMSSCYKTWGQNISQGGEIVTFNGQSFDIGVLLGATDNADLQKARDIFNKHHIDARSLLLMVGKEYIQSHIDKNGGNRSVLARNLGSVLKNMTSADAYQALMENEELHASQVDTKVLAKVYETLINDGNFGTLLKEAIADIPAAATQTNGGNSADKKPISVAMNVKKGTYFVLEKGLRKGSRRDFFYKGGSLPTNVGFTMTNTKDYADKTYNNMEDFMLAAGAVCEDMGIYKYSDGSYYHQIKDLTSGRICMYHYDSMAEAEKVMSGSVKQTIAGGDITKYQCEQLFNKMNSRTFGYLTMDRMAKADDGSQEITVRIGNNFKTFLNLKEALADSRVRAEFEKTAAGQYVCGVYDAYKKINETQAGQNSAKKQKIFEDSFLDVVQYHGRLEAGDMDVTDYLRFELPIHPDKGANTNYVYDMREAIKFVRSHASLFGNTEKVRTRNVDRLVRTIEGARGENATSYNILATIREEIESHIQSGDTSVAHYATEALSKLESIQRHMGSGGKFWEEADKIVAYDNTMDVAGGKSLEMRKERLGADFIRATDRSRRAMMGKIHQANPQMDKTEWNKFKRNFQSSKSIINSLNAVMDKYAESGVIFEFGASENGSKTVYLYNGADSRAYHDGKSMIKFELPIGDSHNQARWNGMKIANSPVPVLEGNAGKISDVFTEAVVAWCNYMLSDDVYDSIKSGNLTQHSPAANRILHGGRDAIKSVLESTSSVSGYGTQKELLKDLEAGQTWQQQNQRGATARWDIINNAVVDAFGKDRFKNSYERRGLLTNLNMYVSLRSAAEQEKNANSKVKLLAASSKLLATTFGEEYVTAISNVYDGSNGGINLIKAIPANISDTQEDKAIAARNRALGASNYEILGSDTDNRALNQETGQYLARSASKSDMKNYMARGILHYGAGTTDIAMTLQKEYYGEGGSGGARTKDMANVNSDIANAQYYAATVDTDRLGTVWGIMSKVLKNADKSTKINLRMHLGDDFYNELLSDKSGVFGRNGTWAPGINEGEQVAIMKDAIETLGAYRERSVTVDRKDIAKSQKWLGFFDKLVNNKEGWTLSDGGIDELLADRSLNKLTNGRIGKTGRRMITSIRRIDDQMQIEYRDYEDFDGGGIKVAGSGGIKGNYNMVNASSNNPIMKLIWYAASADSDFGKNTKGEYDEHILRTQINYYINNPDKLLSEAKHLMQVTVAHGALKGADTSKARVQYLGGKLRAFESFARDSGIRDASGNLVYGKDALRIMQKRINSIVDDNGNAINIIDRVETKNGVPILVYKPNAGDYNRFLAGKDGILKAGADLFGDNWKYLKNISSTTLNAFDEYKYYEEAMVEYGEIPNFKGKGRFKITPKTMGAMKAAMMMSGMTSDQASKLENSLVHHTPMEAFAKIIGEGLENVYKEMGKEGKRGLLSQDTAHLVLDRQGNKVNGKNIISIDDPNITKIWGFNNKAKPDEVISWMRYMWQRGGYDSSQKSGIAYISLDNFGGGNLVIKDKDFQYATDRIAIPVYNPDILEQNKDLLTQGILPEVFERIASVQNHFARGLDEESAAEQWNSYYSAIHDLYSRNGGIWQLSNVSEQGSASWKKASMVLSNDLQNASKTGFFDNAAFLNPQSIRNMLTYEVDAHSTGNDIKQALLNIKSLVTIAEGMGVDTTHDLGDKQYKAVQGAQKTLINRIVDQITVKSITKDENGRLQFKVKNGKVLSEMEMWHNPFLDFMARRFPEVALMSLQAVRLYAYDAVKTETGFIGKGAWELMNGDYDGDAMQFWRALSNIDPNDKNAYAENKKLIEAWREYQDYRAYMRTTLNDTSKIGVAKGSGVSEDANDHWQKSMIGVMSKFNKQPLGQLSLRATAVRNLMTDMYAPKSGSDTVAYNYLFQQTVVSGLGHFLEQESISSKNMAEVIADQVRAGFDADQIVERLTAVQKINQAFTEWGKIEETGVEGQRLGLEKWNLITEQLANLGMIKGEKGNYILKGKIGLDIMSTLNANLARYSGNNASDLTPDQKLAHTQDWLKTKCGVIPGKDFNIADLIKLTDFRDMGNELLGERVAKSMSDSSLASLIVSMADGIVMDDGSVYFGHESGSLKAISQDSLQDIHNWVTTNAVSTNGNKVLIKDLANKVGSINQSTLKEVVGENRLSKMSNEDIARFLVNVGRGSIGTNGEVTNISSELKISDLKNMIRKDVVSDNPNDIISRVLSRPDEVSMDVIYNAVTDAIDYFQNQYTGLKSVKHYNIWQAQFIEQLQSGGVFSQLGGGDAWKDVVRNMAKRRIDDIDSMRVGLFRQAKAQMIGGESEQMALSAEDALLLQQGMGMLGKYPKLKRLTDKHTIGVNDAHEYMDEAGNVIGGDQFSTSKTASDFMHGKSPIGIYAVNPQVDALQSYMLKHPNENIEQVKLGYGGETTREQLYKREYGTMMHAYMQELGDAGWDLSKAGNFFNTDASGNYTNNATGKFAKIFGKGIYTDQLQARMKATATAVKDALNSEYGAGNWHNVANEYSLGAGFETADSKSGSYFSTIDQVLALTDANGNFTGFAINDYKNKAHGLSGDVGVQENEAAMLFANRLAEMSTLFHGGTATTQDEERQQADFDRYLYGHTHRENGKTYVEKGLFNNNYGRSNDLGGKFTTWLDQIRDKTRADLGLKANQAIDANMMDAYKDKFVENLTSSDTNGIRMNAIDLGSEGHEVKLQTINDIGQNAASNILQNVLHGQSVADIDSSGKLARNMTNIMLPPGASTNKSIWGDLTDENAAKAIGAYTTLWNKKGGLNAKRPINITGNDLAAEIGLKNPNESTLAGLGVIASSLTNSPLQNIGEFLTMSGDVSNPYQMVAQSMLNKTAVGGLFNSDATKNAEGMKVEFGETYNDVLSVRLKLIGQLEKETEKYEALVQKGDVAGANASRNRVEALQGQIKEGEDRESDLRKAAGDKFKTKGVKESEANMRGAAAAGKKAELDELQKNNAKEQYINAKYMQEVSRRGENDPNFRQSLINKKNAEKYGLQAISAQQAYLDAGGNASDLAGWDQTDPGSQVVMSEYKTYQDSWKRTRDLERKRDFLARDPIQNAQYLAYTNRELVHQENIRGSIRQAGIIGKDDIDQMDFEQGMEMAMMGQKAGGNKASPMMNNLGRLMKGSLQHYLSFGVVYKGIDKVVQSITNLIKYTEQLNATATNLRIVTGGTNKDAHELMQTYNDMGKELGVTTSTVAQSANEWLRQGYNIVDTNNLIESSIKLSKLGMIESGKATSYLTSTMKGFKLEASESMDIVDKLTTLDMNYATSAGDIAEALSRVASVANDAGMSLDSTAAMLTTIMDITQQDSSMAGTAMRSILSRYGSINASDYTKSISGEELEGVNDIEKVLKTIGITIRESSGQMKDFDDVLSAVAEKWINLTDVQKNAISTAMAGTRQRNAFVSLVSNYDQVKKAEEISENSAGQADLKYEAYLESIAYQTERIKNAWEGLALNISGDDGLIWIFDKLADVLEHVIPIFQKAAQVISALFIDKLNIGVGKLGAYAFGDKFAGSKMANRLGVNVTPGAHLGGRYGAVVTQAGAAGGPTAIPADPKLQSTMKDYEDLQDNYNKNYASWQARVKKIQGKHITKKYSAAKKYQDLQDLRNEDNAARTKINEAKGQISHTNADTSNIQASTGAKFWRFGWKQKAAEADKQLGTEFQVDKNGNFVLDASGNKQLNMDTNTTWGAFNSARASYLANNTDANKTALINADNDLTAGQINSAQMHANQNYKVSNANVALYGLTSAVTGFSAGNQSMAASVSGQVLKAANQGVLGKDKTTVSDIESTAGDRVVSGALQGAGGAIGAIYGGPIGAMVGSEVGDVLSTGLKWLVHYEDIAREDRVKLANKTLEKIDEVTEAIEGAKDLLHIQEFEDYTSEDWSTYNEFIKQAQIGLLGEESTLTVDGEDHSIANIFLENLGFELENVGDVASTAARELKVLSNSATDSSDAIRTMAAYQGALLETKAWATYASNESSIEELDEKIESSDYDLVRDYINLTNSGNGTAAQFKELEDTYADRYDGKSIQTGVLGYKALLAQKEQYKTDLYDSLLEAGLYTSGANSMSELELGSTSSEALILRIAKAWSEKTGNDNNVFDASGNLTSDAKSAIVSAMKEDSTLGTVFSSDKRFIGDYVNTSAEKQREQLLSKYSQYSTYEELVKAAKNEKWAGGETDRNNILNLDTSAITDFAHQLNMTTDQLRESGDAFSWLSESDLSLSAKELQDKFSTLSGYIDEVISKGHVSVETLETIITNNPYLLKDENGNISQDNITGNIISLLAGNGSATEAYGRITANNAETDASRWEQFKALYSEDWDQIGLGAYADDLNKAETFSEVSKYFYTSEGEEAYSAWSDMLTDLTGVLDQMTSLRSSIIKYEQKLLDNEITELTSIKDTLNSINEQREQELKLIKAKMQLENAQNEKKRVYRAGIGWTYEADQTAVQEAKTAVEEAEQEKESQDLQYQIDLLTQEKEILGNIEADESWD